MNVSRLGGGPSWIALIFFMLLFGIVLLTPLSGLALWLVPSTMVVFVYRGKRFVPLIMALLSAIGLYVAGLGLTALFVAFGLYCVAWVMGESMQQSEAAFPALLAGTLVFIMIFLVMLAFLKWTGVSLQEVAAQQSANSLSAYRSVFHLTGTNPKQLGSDVSHQLLLMLPGILCIGGFVISLLNYVLASTILSVQGSYHRAPILSAWNISPSVSWLYIISMTFVVFGWWRESSYGWPVVNNVMLLSGFVIAIQGEAAIWRHIRTWPLRLLWLWLLMILTALLSTLFIFIGLLDSVWKNRRKV